MRKNLKKKLIAVIEKLGPEMWDNFEKLRLIKRQKSTEVELRSKSSKRATYYEELEMNTAFESLRELGI